MRSPDEEMSMLAIAKKLGISERSVARALDSAFAKLKVADLTGFRLAVREKRHFLDSKLGSRPWDCTIDTEEFDPQDMPLFPEAKF